MSNWGGAAAPNPHNFRHCVNTILARSYTGYFQRGAVKAKTRRPRTKFFSLTQTQNIESSFVVGPTFNIIFLDPNSYLCFKQIQTWSICRPQIKEPK